MREEKRDVSNTENQWVYLESVIENLLLVMATFSDAKENMEFEKKT